MEGIEPPQIGLESIILPLYYILFIHLKQTLIPAYLKVFQTIEAYAILMKLKLTKL